MRKRIGMAAALAAWAGPASGAALDGVWGGHYTCAQGDTALELFISTAPDGKLDALFHFGDGSLSRPEGCFAMRGGIAPGGLSFTATRWITRPYGYVTVDLLGSVHAESYGGRVAGPGCTVFSLQRVPPVATPAVCQKPTGLVS